MKLETVHRYQCFLGLIIFSENSACKQQNGDLSDIRVCPEGVSSQINVNKLYDRLRCVMHSIIGKLYSHW